MMKQRVLRMFMLVVACVLAASQAHGSSVLPGGGDAGVLPVEGGAPMVFVDNFDSYADGSQMHGQGGWKGWDNTPAFGALVTSALSHSGPHSIEISGPSDLLHEFSGFTSGQWELTAWIYVPGNFVGSSYVVALNTYSDGGPKNWSLQDHFDSATGLLVSDGTALTRPYLTDQWVEYRVEIDLDTNMQTVFYNGLPFYTASWTEGLSGGGVLNIAAFDFFANGASAIFYDDVSLCPEGGCGVSGLATFLVSKDFNDGNPGEVTVTLSCNTGLPLEQTTEIAEGDPVNFVITDFEDGTLDCEVTEVTPAGYSVQYDNGTSLSAESCAYEGIDGQTSGTNACVITNTLEDVEIVVTKEWIDENPKFNAQNVADANWSCSNVAFGDDDGFLQFFGNPDSDSFFVFPDWETGTSCSIDEVFPDESGVEVNDGDCQSLVVFPGGGASCTIVNTRLYEGIPTLSQYGLALLALLMLGIGFVAYRRLL